MDQLSKEISDELKKQGKAADREDRERAELLAQLLKHPGWVVYAGLLSARMQSRADLLLQPEQTLNSGPEQTNSEHVKGTMNGLLYALQISSATIDAMKTLQKPDGDDQ